MNSLSPGLTPQPDARSVGLAQSIWISLWPFVTGLVFAGLLQLVLPSAFGPYWGKKVAMDIGVAMMLAVSLNIVNGLTGQFSIGHAGFMTLGGYTAATLTYYVSLYVWDTTSATALPWTVAPLFVVACVLGGVMSAAAGYLVGLPSLRLRGDYLAIVTLGFGEILRVVLTRTNDTVFTSRDELLTAKWSELIPPPVGGSLGFTGVPQLTNLFWVYSFLGVTVVLAYRLKQSSLGRAMISIREDEIAAQAMGVHIARYKVLAFVMSAFFAGIAGGLFAHQSGVIISPTDAGFQRSFDYVIMTVLGGRGSITGVMLAAFILTALPEVLRDFEQYRLIMFALLLIVMMIVRPQGLFGIHEIWNFWPSKWQRTGQGTGTKARST